MSFFQNLMGNAVAITEEDSKAYIAEVLVENEQVTAGFKLFRDVIIFTNERLVYINVQGVTGKKQSMQSIPFSSIKWFSMESAGSFDLDCQITLGVQSISLPVSLKFQKGTDLKPIYKILSNYALRDN